MTYNFNLLYKLIDTRRLSLLGEIANNASAPPVDQTQSNTVGLTRTNQGFTGVSNMPLTFTGLTAGEQYKLVSQITAVPSSQGYIYVKITYVNNATILAFDPMYIQINSEPVQHELVKIFTATSTSITVDLDLSSIGSNTVIGVGDWIVSINNL